ncbi:serum response factor-binding protein 1 isoform 2-T2 [Aulostomus maculatus]
MIDTKDQVEAMMPFPEEEQREEVSGEEDDNDGEQSSDEEEAKVGDQAEKKIPSPSRAKDKKPPDVLNLNNEVVKMRKEVKRVRALIIRKLIRQIASLKKMKGKEAEMEKNQRRAARLLQEIHAMKVLVPDKVTKTALQRNLNFEQVCKNHKSTISDRATARIATHPQFKKKIDDIKAAVKAFKDERMKGEKKGEPKGKARNEERKVVLPAAKCFSKKGENTGREEEKEKEDCRMEQRETAEAGDEPLKSTKDSSMSKHEKGTHSLEDQKKIMPETKSVSPPLTKSNDRKDVKPQTKCLVIKPKLQAEPETLQTDDESDLESSGDEEKPYFDDSTEERFHKQSSQSEESDSGDDFFMGKVTKFKKKKKKSMEGAGQVGHIGKGHAVQNTSDQVQVELDELESRLKSKAIKLQSVFCSSLSSSKPSRGRGGNKLRGQGRGSGGVNREFGKWSEFQTQEKARAAKPGAKYSKPHHDSRHPESEETSSPSASRGRSCGRGGAFGQRGGRGGGVFSHQALHPSWEASKKRKEQQGQILAFQGKKIKFDDDDD